MYDVLACPDERLLRATRRTVKVMIRACFICSRNGQFTELSLGVLMEAA